MGTITSMCTEPILAPNKFGYQSLDFLRRHIAMESTYEEIPKASRVGLEFWVEWHTFLTEMRFPTYQIEQVEIEDICKVAGLSEHCKKHQAHKSKKNQRPHREKFNWQELYTIDP